MFSLFLYFEQESFLFPEKNTEEILFRPICFFKKQVPNLENQKQVQITFSPSFLDTASLVIVRFDRIFEDTSIMTNNWYIESIWKTRREAEIQRIKVDGLIYQDYQKPWHNDGCSPVGVEVYQILVNE